MNRVLVCGGRTFDDYDCVERELLARAPIDCIIQGGARGADMLAAKVARLHGIECITFYAQWDTDGRAAGPKRNRRMLDEGKPTFVLAFPGGCGTADMVRRAKRAGTPVYLVSP